MIVVVIVVFAAFTKYRVFYFTLLFTATADLERLSALGDLNIASSRYLPFNCLPFFSAIQLSLHAHCLARTRVCTGAWVVVLWPIYIGNEAYVSYLRLLSALLASQGLY